MTNKKVQSILIAQPKPETKSPYHDLAEKLNLAIEFRPFIDVEYITSKEFRKSRVHPIEYDSVVFTSRNSITYFFKLCEELRYKPGAEIKYFCSSESIAVYLQKYIEYRKRKVFFDKEGIIKNFKELLKKHKNTSKFMYICGLGEHHGEIYNYLKENNFTFVETPVYKTVFCDLSNLNCENYDMIVFFSPFSVKAFVQNFSTFEQNDTLFAAFGAATIKAVEDAKYNPNIKAPVPEIPSMAMAIEKYLKQNN